MGSNRRRHNRYKTSGAGLPWRQALAAAAGLAARAALLAAASLALIFGHDLLLQSRYFQAERITVAGCSRLSPQEVIAQADLRPGVNTLALNLTLVRKRLLAHPWIADARVRREFPAGIHIRVEEERPVAIVSLDRPWMVNERGQVFKAAARSESGGLPVVSGLSYVDLPAAGSGPGEPFKAVMAILDLGRQPGTPLPIARIDQVVVDRELGVTLVAFGGHKTIRVGYGDYPAKYARLQRLTAYLDAQGRWADYTAIDLNSSERVVAAPVNAPSRQAAKKEV